MMTNKDFKKLVKSILRSEVQENFIENVTNKDIDNAILMAVSKINIYKPLSGYTIEDFLSDQYVPVWLNVVTNGVAYYTLTAQISEWLHNGIDIEIDEFSIENKMADYIQVADRFKDDFLDGIEKIKSQTQITLMKPIIKHAVDVTGGGSLSGRNCRYFKSTKYKV